MDIERRLKSHLQSFFSVISKALRSAGIKDRVRLKAFKGGFLKTNISSYTNKGNGKYFHLVHERNDLRGLVN